MNTLFRQPGVLPYLAVMTLNIFVDLGHKISIQNTVFKIYDGNTQVILITTVNGLILLPFILLFSPAGFIADRHPKNVVMRTAAWVAAGISIAITACYYLGWFWLAFIMTFLLAMQSAIYSPAKYSYIKLLFGKENLAQANGVVQAVTIAAILVSTFVFSILFESLFPASTTSKSAALKAIAPIGWLLIVNSLLELIVAYRLPELDHGNVNKQFVMRDFLTGRATAQNIRLVINNRTIKLSATGLAVFWSVGQVLLAAFPAFAKENMNINNTVIIQGVLAATGIGIAIGSALAARWSRGHIETGLIPFGAAGIGLGLLFLPRILSIEGHIANFLLIGLAGGLFIVPLNALIQFNARNDESGTVIAGNNLIQNVSMFGFLLLTVIFAISGYNSTTLLMIIAGVACVGGVYTVYKLPQCLIRIILTLLSTHHYNINVQGLNNIPAQGGVLLLGNHVSWTDWAIIQIASARPVRFIMAKRIYERRYLQWFFKLLGCIAVETDSSNRTLHTVATLLDQGEVVCLFPGGHLIQQNSDSLFSQDSPGATGHLINFRTGYQRICELTRHDMIIIPFYLDDLSNAQPVRPSQKLKTTPKNRLFRNIIIAFGKPLPAATSTDIITRRIVNLSTTNR